MAYDVVLEAGAEQRLRRLRDDHPGLAAIVVDHLLALAESPVELSRPSVFPRPPGFQQYDFSIVSAGLTHRFSVLFKYGQDEATLFVFGIGHVEVP